MNSISAYMKEKGLDDQAMAKVISEKLGRGISAKGVQQIKTRKEAPAPWLRALGIAPNEPGGLKDEKKSRIPGQKPPGESSGEIQPLVSLPFEITSAKVTIEMVYTMAGKGVAMASRTPRTAELWEKSAPALADGWIEWAKENRTVANGIAMLTIGGPGGQVILTNASLIISTLMMIQQAKGIDIFPPQFRPPHEQPEGSEQKIQENTEAAVEDALRNSQG